MVQRNGYTGEMVTRAQRMLGLLALAALISGPVGGAVCAIWCAPHGALARAEAGATVMATASATAAAHHHHETAASSHGCCDRPAARVVASVGSMGCDTHGTPDRDQLATLIALRPDTHSPIAMLATVFDRTAVTLAASLHTAPSHGPPLDTSHTPRSRSLVLRV